MTRVRFAIAPTGLLFVSGARVALANALFARRRGGRMLLRFDDLEEERCSPAHADQIMQDLLWFGIDWDARLRQSERRERYLDAIGRLQQAGRLYPCFESEEELRAKREFRRKRNQPTIYDRAMLALTDRQRAAAEAGGKRPHWRMRLPNRTLAWRDLVLGERQAVLAAVSDPVLVRADGSATPILAGVVDDIDHGTTHVIRGEDGVANTAVQIELFEALTGAPAAVRFAHLPSPEAAPGAEDGGKATPRRRTGNPSLRGLRNDGVEPGAIAASLFPSGRGDRTPEALARTFELTDFAASAFDAGRMLAANRRVLARLDFAAVADRLPEGATEAFWLAVRDGLDLLREARGWWDVVAGTIVPPVMEGERDLLADAEALLPPEPWDASVLGRWVAALERATGRAAGELPPPLRLALTGEDAGPDLAGLLPLIGRSRAVDRLRTAAA